MPKYYCSSWYYMWKTLQSKYRRRWSTHPNCTNSSWEKWNSVESATSLLFLYCTLSIRVQVFDCWAKETYCFQIPNFSFRIRQIFTFCKFWCKLFNVLSPTTNDTPWLKSSNNLGTLRTLEVACHCWASLDLTIVLKTTQCKMLLPGQKCLPGTGQQNGKMKSF